jgi:hypothetical protein
MGAGGVNTLVKKNNDLETDWLIIVLILILTVGYLAIVKK